ncbi:MAG: DNA alkylation repair protein [Bacteroidales bacterium]|nr:DNA alkylation repair protein [Bacteroidales bacterium]
MIEHLLTPLISQRFLEDERYRTGHIRVINALNDVRILGVHIPELKKLAKELSRRDDAAELIASFESESTTGSLYFEEKLVWGLMINALKATEDHKLALLMAFVPAIDNWAVCDTICCNIKWIKDRNTLWGYLQPYFDSDKEFEVRFAVVMSMIFFLDAESFPKVAARLDSLDFSRIHSEFLSPKEAKHAEKVRGVAKGERPYYVRMAVAWLLATGLAKIPEMTRAYVNSCSLPEDVIRLYKRKARESFKTRDVNPL